MSLLRIVTGFKGDEGRDEVPSLIYIGYDANQASAAAAAAPAEFHTVELIVSRRGQRLRKDSRGAALAAEKVNDDAEKEEANARAEAAAEAEAAEKAKAAAEAEAAEKAKAAAEAEAAEKAKAAAEAEAGDGTAADAAGAAEEEQTGDGPQLSAPAKKRR